MRKPCANRAQTVRTKKKDVPAFRGFLRGQTCLLTDPKGPKGSRTPPSGSVLAAAPPLGLGGVPPYPPWPLPGPAATPRVVKAPPGAGKARTDARSSWRLPRPSLRFGTFPLTRRVAPPRGNSRAVEPRYRDGIARTWAAFHAGREKQEDRVWAEPIVARRSSRIAGARKVAEAVPVSCGRIIDQHVQQRTHFPSTVP